jgi:hypothetical protein
MAFIGFWDLFLTWDTLFLGLLEPFKILSCFWYVTYRMFHLSEDGLSMQHHWGSQHSSDIYLRMSMLRSQMASCLNWQQSSCCQFDEQSVQPCPGTGICYTAWFCYKLFMAL